MITLPHTAMQVPTDEIAVTHVTEDTSTGALYTSAVLVRQGRIIGVLTRDGDIPTRFDGSARARRAVAKFADQCRDHNGEPLTPDQVYDLLITEAVTAHEVSLAERDDVHLIRLTPHEGTAQLFQMSSREPVDDATALRQVQQVPISTRVARAELWMGHEEGWTQYYPLPR